MNALSHTFLLMALSLTAPPADLPATTSLSPENAALTVELDTGATLADSILGENPEMLDFIRRLA